MNYQISENFRTESELRSLRKRRANECYKESGGDCLVEASNTIRLHPEFCKYCKKLKGIKNTYKKDRSDILKLSLIEEKAQSKEIKTPKYEIQKFKFPIDLIDYPIKKTKDFKTINKKGKSTLELFLSGYYGEYLIKTFRQFKIMDYRTLLAVLYFADYHKDKRFEEKFVRYLDLLEVADIPFYRKSIIMGMDFLSDLKFYTPYIYDSQLKRRSSSFNLTEKGEIDFYNLPSFSVFHLIDSYHHISIRQKDKRKSKIKVKLNDIFYKRIFLDKYYTLIDFKKILPLRDISLNLYFFIKKQDPKNISNYTIDFEILKAQIGITDRHITNARLTFEKAWGDIKDRDLLKGYRHRIFISKKNNREYIKFVKQRSLEPSIINN